jgi:TolA-binding protein
MSQPPEDLLYRARAGQLTDTERQELVQAIESSATWRVAYQLGCDFDEVDSVKPGDDLLIARVSDLVVQRHGEAIEAQRFGSWSGMDRGRRWLLAASLLLTLSAAAAVSVWRGSLRFGLHRPAHSVPSAGVSARPAARTSTMGPATSSSSHEGSALTTSPLEVNRMSPAAALGVPSTPNRGSPPIAPSSPPLAQANATSVGGKTQDAESLFRQANAARRDGHLERALELYSTLQARFKGTTEARLSHISLAKLLLALGRAAEADAQFTQYLARGGPLDLEALVGRADCQRLVGNAAAERVVWRQLLERFPSSVYAARARQRLFALGEPAP